MMGALPRSTILGSCFTINTAADIIVCVNTHTLSTHAVHGALGSGACCFVFERQLGIP